MAERGKNKVILVGNVGQDPEIRRPANSSDAVASLSVATSEVWKDKQTGEQQEKTEWHRCVVWGRTAEFIEKYIHRGRKVYIEGKLQTRKWTDNNNVERYTTEIVITELQALDKVEGNGAQQGSSGSSPQQQGGFQPQQQQQQAPANTGASFDDDIPF